MGKYTVYNESWIDQAIQKHIDLAVAELKKMPGIQGAVLVGGFGRGEGSVKIEDNKVIPLNDYDIYAIFDRSVGEEEINQVADKLNRLAGSSGFSLTEHSSKDFYFDIRPLQLSNLSKMLPLIKYYEMKHASYVLFGSDFREKIPDYQTSDIPISEAFRFIFNRMSSVFYWTPVKYIKEQTVEQWERDVLLYDVSKSYLEIITSLVLLADIFKPTYQQRLVELEKIYNSKYTELNKKFPDLLEQMKYYNNLKLKPEYQAIDNHAERWFKARRHLLGVAESFCQKVFGVKDWSEFTKQVSHRYFKPYLKTMWQRKIKIAPSLLVNLSSVLVQLYLSLLFFFRVRKAKKVFHWSLLFNFKDPGIIIFNALPYLFSSLQRDGSVDKDLLSKGLALLKKVYPIKIDVPLGEQNFEEVVKEYINIWKLYYFQKIV